MQFCMRGRKRGERKDWRGCIEVEVQAKKFKDLEVMRDGAENGSQD